MELIHISNWSVLYLNSNDKNLCLKKLYMVVRKPQITSQWDNTEQRSQAMAMRRCNQSLVDKDSQVHVPGMLEGMANC